MSRSKIEWCDHTLNIITGCRHNCEYCYARKMSQRFSGNVKQNKGDTGKYRMDGRNFILDEPFRDENGTQIMYPFGFEPTLHRYRYNTLDKLKQGQNIFVGAMADVFGEWVPDEWIADVLQACADHPQHNYLFLTKNPKRYITYNAPTLPNFWYGTTVTKTAELDRLNDLPTGANNFVSIEPLLEDLDAGYLGEMLKMVRWVIIGAETGKRKGKVKPEPAWVQKIVVEADYAGIPVFMKNSLVPIVAEKDMRRDFPQPLTVHKRSEKVNHRLQGSCMLCGKTRDKNRMVTLIARTVRKGKTAAFGYMCRPCFRKWLREHHTEIPNLEGLKPVKVDMTDEMIKELEGHVKKEL